LKTIPLVASFLAEKWIQLIGKYQSHAKRHPIKKNHHAQRDVPPRDCAFLSINLVVRIFTGPRELSLTALYTGPADNHGGSSSLISFMERALPLLVNIRMDIPVQFMFNIMNCFTWGRGRRTGRVRKKPKIRQDISHSNCV